MSQSNKMSVMQLTILTAVNMMGSGIIMLPTKLAQVGALSIVSWLVTAVGSMCLASHGDRLHVPCLCICQMRHVQ